MGLALDIFGFASIESTYNPIGFVHSSARNELLTETMITDYTCILHEIFVRNKISFSVDFQKFFRNIFQNIYFYPILGKRITQVYSYTGLLIINNVSFIFSTYSTINFLTFPLFCARVLFRI